MLTRNIRCFYVFVLLLAVTVVFFGCGYQGDPHENQPPTIRISSFTGTDDDWVKYDEDGKPIPVPYQQVIHWTASDVDGFVVGYAFRVLDEEGNPIQTAGNFFIDLDPTNKVTPIELSTFRPRGGFFAGRQLGEGWVLHYERGALEEFPLDDVRAQRTIWTDRVSVVINFPARSNPELGDDPINNPNEPLPMPSIFQVVAIDNRGGISQPAEKFFFATTRTPIPGVNTSRGPLHTTIRHQETGAIISYNRATLGQGIRFLFSMETRDREVDGVVPTRPWYFYYRLGHVTNDADSLSLGWIGTGGITLDNHEGGQWFSTRDFANPRETVLTATTDPPLDANVNSGLFDNQGNIIWATATVMEVIAVDLAGVHSHPWRSFRFFINDEFRPQARFYYAHSYVLGDHHWAPIKDTDNTADPPAMSTPAGVRNAMAFTPMPKTDERGNFLFFDDNGNIVPEGTPRSRMDFIWGAVGNEQTRFWFRWGYNGEFHDSEQEDPERLVPFNNPDHRQRLIVRDSLGVNYRTEIAYFHLQLNGEPFIFGPLVNPSCPFFQQGWLRIPVGHEIAQRVSFNGLAPGRIHELRLRAEDLAGNWDPSPAVFRFQLVAPNAPGDRQGVLLINYATYVEGSPHAGVYEELQQYYRDILPAGTNIQFVHRRTFESLRNATSSRYMSPGRNTQGYMSSLDVRGWPPVRREAHLFPYSLLTQYRYVIIATDTQNYGARLSIRPDLDGIRNYMSNSGTVILIGHSNITHLHREFIETHRSTFLTDFFGFPRFVDHLAALTLSTNAIIPGDNQYFFIGATPASGTNNPTLRAELDNNPDRLLTPNFPTWIRERRGLANISYLTGPLVGGTPLYLFNCKPAGYGPVLTVGTRQIDFGPNEEQHREIHGSVVAFRKANNQGFGYTIMFPPFHMNKDDMRAMFARIIN